MVNYAYTAYGIPSKSINENLQGEFINEALSIMEENIFLYKGYIYDCDTNMYYCMSRYYDPEIGRWLSIDDVGYLDSQSVQGLNLYAYCGNNPVMYLDRDGNSPTKWWEWALAGTLVAGLIVGSVLTGGLLGAAFIGASSIGSQLIGGKSFDEINWWSVGVSAFIGGAAGFIGGAGARNKGALFNSKSVIKAQNGVSGVVGRFAQGGYYSSARYAQAAFTRTMNALSREIGSQMTRFFVKTMITYGASIVANNIIMMFI